MSRPFHKTYSPATEDLDAIVNDGTGATLTLLVSSAGDGLAHQIAIASGANISTLVFTITGTDADGVAQTDTITGISNSTVESTKYFLTWSSITISATLGANTVDIGWVDEFVTPTIPLNRRANNGAAFEVVVTGTIDYDVQQTLSDLGSPPPWNWTDIPAELVDAVDLIAVTASEQFRMSPLPSGIRLAANSYSAAAKLDLYIVHSS